MGRIFTFSVVVKRARKHISNPNKTRLSEIKKQNGALSKQGTSPLTFTQERACESGKGG